MSAPFLTVVATVLQVGGPLLGAGVAEVDRGLDDGLRPGDVGAVYYVLQVGPTREPRRIDVGRAEVARATAETASLNLGPDLVVRPYYSVEFEVPRERFSTAGRLLEEASAALDAGRAEEARLLLAAAEKVTAPEDAAARERRRDLEGLLPPSKAPPAPVEPGSVEPGSVEPGSVEPGSVEPGSVSPAPPPSGTPDPGRPDPGRPDPGRPDPRMRGVPMADVPGGTYTIGADDDEARFYNQQPRFFVTLAPFRIDLRPVTWARFSPSRRDDVGLPATNVTFAEARAHCRRRGGRLPTELEWEAAVAGGSVRRGAVYEWTASWYLPYPGNARPEKEYGRRARVLRGGAASADPRLRFFMAPEQRRSDVGFRCVLGGVETERR